MVIVLVWVLPLSCFSLCSTNCTTGDWCYHYNNVVAVPEGPPLYLFLASENSHPIEVKQDNIGVVVIVSKVASKNLNGEINSNTPFTKYVGKFCFGDDGGYVKANINWNDNNIDTARLLLFSDSIDNVVEKVESLSCNNTVTQSYEFNRYSKPSDLYQVEGQGEWYLVIQNCEKYPSNLKYDIHLFNEGDSYYKFLSADYRNVPVALKIFIFIGMSLINLHGLSSIVIDGVTDEIKVEDNISPLIVTIPPK
ncbi:hypothetical protein ACTFIR_011823 [Dictyostelium discoideum]